MEAATVTPTEQPQDAPATDATKTPAELFRYSAFVHVGPGADDCDEGEKGTCQNPLHFHAWCRLPNQFQHNDIRQRALAAKARRMRQLRDPESDSYVILEADMEEVARTGDHETVVDELVAKEWWKRHLDAMKDVAEDERFEHIDRDRERVAEIDTLEPDKRPHEEREELLRHLESYGDAVEAKRKELEQPIRDSLMAMDMDELVKLLRDDRIASEASAAFMDTYQRWQWFAGTLKPVESGRPTDRAFSSIEQLEAAAPEVIAALRETFSELEVSLQRGATGNS